MIRENRNCIERGDLEEIKSALGFPLVEELDWGGDSDDYIRKYIVPRVLRTYFTYFPMKTATFAEISGSFEIDYPETNVFRMLRHYFNYKNLDYATTSPFLLQTMILAKGDDKPFHVANKEFNETFSRLSTAESIIDYTKALRVEDYPQDRKIKGETNLSGTLTVEWAKKSIYFNDIIYNYKDDAIKLAKAYLLQDSYRLREQAKVQSKVEINTQVFLEDASRWETEVTEKWKKRGFAIIIK